MDDPQRPPRFWTVVSLGVALLAGGILTGCGGEAPPESYVARVGDQYLSQASLEASLDGLGEDADTSEARKQIIEQWVTKALLYREAERLNLRDDPEIQEEIRERERSILVTALTDKLYQEASVGPTEAEVRAYFQRNQANLVLREPFVRVRHLSTERETAADSVRSALQQAALRGTPTDSLWSALVNQHASNPEAARRLATQFVAESRLFGHLPYLRDELAELNDNQLAPVVVDDSLYHVLQLVQRISEGSEPELNWVKDEIRRRLLIRSRKQMYAREVQRLRNEAQARNALEIR